MSAILQSCPKNGAGRILTDSVGAIDHYHNGLPFTAAGALCTNNGVPAYYHQGLPFSTNGRLCTAGGSPLRFSTGSAGFGTGEQMAVAGDAGGAMTHFIHGNGYVADGRVAAGT